MYVGCATMKDGSVCLFYADDFEGIAIAADKHMHNGACRVDIAQAQEEGEKVEC